MVDPNTPSKKMDDGEHITSVEPIVDVPTASGKISNGPRQSTTNYEREQARTSETGCIAAQAAPTDETTNESCLSQTPVVDHVALVEPTKSGTVTEDPTLPAAHRRARDDVNLLKGDGLEALDVLTVDPLQEQFKHLSSILSGVRHLEGDIETVDIRMMKPVDVPSDVLATRRYLKTITDLDWYCGLVKKYLKYDLSDDPGKMSVLPTETKDIRTQNVRILLRIIGCLGDITQPEVQTILERGISAVGSRAVNESALVTLARIADERRRLGTTVMALNTSQKLMALMESCLHLLTMQPTLTTMIKHALVLVWILLIGDKERADEDKVDVQSVVRALIDPYICGPGPTEWYIGVMALNYLWLADRGAVKDYVFFTEMAPTLLGLCADYTDGEARLQGAALNLVVGLVEYNELRMMFLQNGIVDVMTAIGMLQRRDVKTQVKVAACLARLSLHNDETRKRIFEDFEFFDLTKDVVTKVTPEELNDPEGQDLTQLVLEVVFFLSMHSSFKAQLVTALAPAKGEDIIRNEDRMAALKAPALVEGLPKFGASAAASNNPLCMYTYCGIICNLTRSSEDKEKLKRVPGMPQWDDEQMEQVEMMMEKLPDNAKPISNGKFDRGDDSLVSELVSSLVKCGALTHVCAILMKSQISTNMAAMGASAIRQCVTKQPKVYQGAIVKVGGFSALLNACSILQRDQEWNVGAADELRQIRQTLAQLAMGVSPAAMSYKEKCSLVPHMMHLLDDRHQLFNYEGLLVLTNIASQSEEARDAIYHFKNSWQKITNCAFEDHDMVRAAACELIANMMLCDLLLDRFAEGKYIPDIHFLMACCQEVTNDRCLHASSGALAMMTKDLRVGTVVLEKLSSIESVFEILQICVAKKDAALLTRMACFIRNIVQGGIEQIGPDGRPHSRPDLVSAWRLVHPHAEVILDALQKDLDCLRTKEEVRQLFVIFKAHFLQAITLQRKTS